MVPIMIVLIVIAIFWFLPKLLLFLTGSNDDVGNPKAESRLFSERFINSKELFLKRFGAMPWMCSISNVDTDKVIQMIKAGEFGEIAEAYQRTYHDWQTKERHAWITIFIIRNRLLLEIGENHVELLFHGDQSEATDAIHSKLIECKAPAKEKDHEINIISLDSSGLNLKAVAIKKVELDIPSHYNNDFVEVDKLIKTRLSKENDKGIILLHGIPGTGKTSYLRHLVGEVNKKVLFVSPSVAKDLMNPEFVDLLLDNPNSILVIEDAENIIMDRKFSSHSSVSNLLNLSDGLMSDCMNVQIVCTFNSPIAMVDTALMRKGRLIAKYEFGPLALEKARALSKQLGLDTVINRPMTLAEIANPGEKDHSKLARVEEIGFRREREVVPS